MPVHFNFWHNITLLLAHCLQGTDPFPQAQIVQFELNELNFWTITCGWWVFLWLTVILPFSFLNRSAFTWKCFRNDFCSLGNAGLWKRCSSYSWAIVLMCQRTVFKLFLHIYTEIKTFPKHFTLEHIFKIHQNDTNRKYSLVIRAVVYYLPWGSCGLGGRAVCLLFKFAHQSVLGQDPEVQAVQ